MGTKVFGPRPLTKLLCQTSAVSKVELAQTLDDEVVLESEAAGGSVADHNIDSAAHTVLAHYTDVASHSTEFAAKAAKSTAVAAIDPVAATSVDASDLATAITLVNELKTNYNSMVTLVLELKNKLNAMNV